VAHAETVRAQAERDDTVAAEIAITDAIAHRHLKDQVPEIDDKPIFTVGS